MAKKEIKKGQAKKTGQNSKKKKDEWFIPPETREILLEKFKDLKESVNLEVFIKKGENDPYNTLSTIFCSDLARLSNKIKTKIFIMETQTKIPQIPEYFFLAKSFPQVSTFLFICECLKI